MKPLFSLSIKPSSKPNPKSSSSQCFFNQEESREKDLNNPRRHYVTEFDASKTLDDKQPIHIIPPLENTWKPTQKMKNLHLPIQIGFEDPTTTGDIISSLSCGLNIRERKNYGSKEFEEEILPKRSEISMSIEELMLKKFKEDIEKFPDDRGFDEFIDCPVEEFGKAILTGYGWKEGKGIGKNSKEEVKIVEVVRRRRGEREGLGYDQFKFGRAG